MPVVLTVDKFACNCRVIQHLFGQLHTFELTQNSNIVVGNAQSLVHNRRGMDVSGLLLNQYNGIFGSRRHYINDLSTV